MNENLGYLTLESKVLRAARFSIALKVGSNIVGETFNRLVARVTAKEKTRQSKTVAPFAFEILSWRTPIRARPKS